LLGEISQVVHDLPALLTAPLYRRWHRHWGATPAEIAASLPGDEFLPHAQFRATRAITIDVPPDHVWPWLVQVGCLRAGWYSNDLLDNLAHPSATTIVSDLQHLEVGQWVPMSPSPTPSDRTALKVHSFELNKWLLWTKPDSTWAWRLTPTDDGGTRLVTRVHAVYDWRHPPSALLGVVLMEFGDFAMQRRMLRGIKTRSESLRRVRPPPSVDLYWIPLGAGAFVVRRTGRLFEWMSALLQRRRPSDLFHSALEVTVPAGRFVIEMTPIPDVHGERRGVVSEGPVGARWAGRLRIFRYELRRWRQGVIPDAGEAINSPMTVSEDLATALRILDLVPSVPTPVWGRDELDAGEMWNSNSVTSWLLARGGVDPSPVPPRRGRAPGWDAGVVVAARDLDDEHRRK
jgi:hypothetical protein